MDPGEDRLNVLRARQLGPADWLRGLAGTALVAAFSAALALLHANSTTAGLVFLVLVVWSATRAGRWLAVYIALLCAVLFDYLFLPPYHTFLLSGGEAWVAMASFLASCVVVSRVAEVARRQSLHAEQRREDVERLYALSQEMMLYEDAAALVRELPKLVERIFELDAVVLYVRNEDRFYLSAGELPGNVRAVMLAMAHGHNPTNEVTGEYFATALLLGLRPLGSLSWKRGRRGGLSHEVAAAVSAQVAIALARSIAIETSTRVEAARESERLRTALTDSLTHELRTPLTAIRAAATTLLGAGELDESGRKDLAGIIDDEAARLDQLIGAAVEMAEIDAHVVRVHPAPHHPRALLDEAVEASRKLLAGHTVVIAPVKLDESAWFDAHLLGRVLRHLLENAAKYTPAGSRIALSSLRTGDRLEFCVEDNGPGINGQDLPLIFEKFYRGKRSTPGGKGSGMGLAITRAILAAHGGGIEATSVPGQGTCFRFWVPLVEKETGKRGSMEKLQSVAASGSHAPPEAEEPL
ncbi:MAG TPA: ATP-binding protein [Terracidiphilus sp.]|nr:ATP-binding protein [Terracidiphilus sp.]